MKIRILFITLSAFMCTILSSQENAPGNITPSFLEYTSHPWVDSVLKTLTTRERIAQSVWIAGYSDRNEAHEEELVSAISRHGVGGVLFFQGTPEKEAAMTNRLQAASKVPLVIAMDAEWGPGMRLQNVEKFPFQMTLGAIRDDSLIYRMGETIAMQCRSLGIHINLAPVADINNNPLNPVINYRSFGENREKVARKAAMYMKGLQDHGIMATLKHFPGHGDTNTDSHYALPVIMHTRERLDSLELYPFRQLINQGAGGVMTAHLSLPVADKGSKKPASLSPGIVSNLLIDDLKFRGLVITDAMNMKGVTGDYRPGEAEALAYLAGNDIIEFVTNIDAALNEILVLNDRKKVTRAEIDQRCRKILAFKYWAGLDRLTPVNEEKLSESLTSPAVKAQIRELYSNAITVLNNEGNIIPVRNTERKIAAVAINRSDNSVFQNRILDYFPADTFFIDPADADKSEKLLAKLKEYDLVIAGIFRTDQRPSSGFGINQALVTFLDRLTSSSRTIISYFGNPYALARVKPLERSQGLLLTYQENDYTEDLAAQLIFGGIGAHGSLPVTINEKWKEGTGIITPGNVRLRFGLPEEADLSSELLRSTIDTIVTRGLKAKAYPGCEVMIAKDGIVVFSETYGYHTYENHVEVKKNDLFDLASLTKIVATTPALMLLEAGGRFNPDRKLGDYLPGYMSSNKGDLTMKEILTHQAGLKAWIPFWEETTRRDTSLKRRLYRDHYSDNYPVKVADSLFLHDNFRKKIFEVIMESPLGKKKFLYSDLGFIMTPEIIDNLSGRSWTAYVKENIHDRIGIRDMVFNPVGLYPIDRIVPTEVDTVFRRQLLHGYVDDEGAALLGGVAGHAGVFSTAGELMKLLELYRRMGEYGGEQIIPVEIVKKYKSVQFPENENRRGLGFDKPLLDNNTKKGVEAYPCEGASPESFGHSGFTGTFVWVDPVIKISYIFLSNRVHPSRDNNLLSQMNIRSDILQAVYDSSL